MNSLKNYIIIGLVLILIIFGIGMYNKCSRLERENIELKLEQDVVKDIIEKENELLSKDILYLENQLIQYQSIIDSLEKVKQTVIFKTEYVVSENITESVALLKENLECEKY